MMFRTESKRPVDLYHMLRDSLIEDALRLGTLRIDLWTVLPPGMSGSRLQTATLLRKLAAKMAKDFPGGIHHTKGIVTFTPTFLHFAKTQQELGVTDVEAKDAWLAFSSIADETRADGAMG